MEGRRQNEGIWGDGLTDASRKVAGVGGTGPVECGNKMIKRNPRREGGGGGDEWRLELSGRGNH